MFKIKLKYAIMQIVLAIILCTIAIYLWNSKLNFLSLSVHSVYGSYETLGELLSVFTIFLEVTNILVLLGKKEEQFRKEEFK